MVDPDRVRQLLEALAGRYLVQAAGQASLEDGLADLNAFAAAIARLVDEDTLALT